jgi:hypothetical protein
MAERRKLPPYARRESLNIRGLPSGLRDLFKAACDEDGRNMSVVIEEFMRKFVAERHGVRYLPPRTRRKQRRNDNGRRIV